VSVSGSGSTLAAADRADPLVIATAPGRDPAAGSPVPDEEGATRVVIVRHGETTFSEIGRFAGQNDVPLTSRGKDQAVAVAERLTVLRPTAVWTSPLERCRATAKPIGWRNRAAVTVADELTDGTLGEWAGLTPEEIAERWPEEFVAWRSDVDVAPPGGESYREVRKRAGAALRGVAEQHPGGTIVLVTHAVVAKMMLVEAMGVPSDTVYRLRVDPASVSMLSIHPDGSTLIWTVNEVGHLVR
jgi:probable phosphoglycerate mutase